MRKLSFKIIRRSVFDEPFPWFGRPFSGAVYVPGNPNPKARYWMVFAFKTMFCVGIPA